MTLTDFERGCLCGAGKFEKSDAKVAQAFPFANRGTVWKYRKVDFKRPKTPKRKLPRYILARRRHVLRLSNIEVTTPKGRKFREFHSVELIRRELQNNPKINIKASKSTVMLDLHAVGKRSIVRRLLCSRERKDVEKRMLFKGIAKHLNPKLIVFSDETWLSTKERTGRREWCSRGEEANPRENKNRRNEPGSFQVWACVGWHFKSKLIIFPKNRKVWRKNKKGTLKEVQIAYRLNSHEYISDCLEKVKKDLNDHRGFLGPKGLDLGEMRFQQDGARCHDAKICYEWYRKTDINLLHEFPPYSPDLNMIELVWKDLHAAIGRRCPETEEELIAAAQVAWDEDITHKMINKHILHFSNAVKAI
jgi:transposase